jgi:hypothetical protein
MSSTIKTFLDETRDLPPSQQVERYSQWLRDNPNDPATIFIQAFLNNAIQQKTIDEALAKKDEALAKKYYDEAQAKKDENQPSRLVLKFFQLFFSLFNYIA